MIPTGRYGSFMLETISASKTKLLEAALRVIRATGYSATTVDDICAAAGLSKGSFFHHFKSKDDLAIAAADYWSNKTGAVFADAAYHRHSDPLARLLGYIDFRKSMIRGPAADFTCLVGTMVQETHETHPAIRDACARSISGHAATLEADIAAAMRQRRIDADWSAESLALHTQAVLQGAFILAKATGDTKVAADSIDHLRRYVELLFQPQG
jgi:TetR/AcrR family transcriptional regulator, transcriptional repressor for nem operon